MECFVDFERVGKPVDGDGGLDAAVYCGGGDFAALGFEVL